MEDAALMLQLLVTELRSARRQLRLPQEELGPGLGVSGLAVGSWETGKDIPALGNFVRWAQALGFSVGVDGTAPGALLVPRSGEEWADFHIRCLTSALVGARERLGRTQEMVGDAVGVSAWSVHMWETGHRVPRMLRLLDWCHYLNVCIILKPRDGVAGRQHVS